MESILVNQHFWLLIAFLLFIAIFFKKIKLHLDGFLNQKIENIKSEIAESEEILSSALMLLNDKKKESEEVKVKNNHLIVKAQGDSDSYYEKLANELNTNIRNSKKSFANYLSTERTRNTNKVYNHIVKKSTDNVKDILQAKLTSEQHHELIAKSISNMNNIMKN